MDPSTRLASYKWLLYLPLLMLYFWVGAQAADPARTEVRIGVLAKRGDEKTIQRWQPTADYLSHEIPKYRFVVVPLDFAEIDRVVAEAGVDFVLANPAIYVGLEKHYGIGRIATMRNRNGQQGYTVFGGVIFTRSDRKDINTLRDISGKHLAAVKENSLGGYQMAWRELAKAGVTLGEDTFLQFKGTHDAVVYAVLNGQADVGTVRSDTLERMNEEGKIRLDQIKVINRQRHANFNYLHSTRLYPEWSFARLVQTGEDLSHDVAIALLRMPVDWDAARSGHVAGWTVPGNYQPVHELMRELRIGPYADLGRITFADLVRNYWRWMILTLLALLLLGAANAYVTQLNRRLRHTEGELRGARDNLIRKVRERTSELEESHQRLERISRDWNDAFDAISDPIFIHDAEMRIVRANPAYCKRAGHDLDEMLGKPYYRYFPCQEGPLPVCTKFPEHPPNEAQTLQLESGEVFVSRSYGIRRSDKTVQHAIHILEDVTAESRANAEMRRLNRALRTLSLCNTTLVHANDENELMDDISHILIENGGYRFAWVGYADTSAEASIYPVAYAGEGGVFLQILNKTMERGSSDDLAQQVLQHTRAVVLRDLSADDSCSNEWCEMTLASGFAAAIAIPLVSQGEVFGVISIFSVETDAFDDAEIELLQEMVGDLSFGIRTLRNRVRREQAEVALKNTEERYQELYENAPSAYLSISGKEGRLIQFNRALIEILGYRRDYLEGMMISQLYADASLARAEQIFSDVEKGRGVRDVELQMRHADGHPVWVSISIDPVFDASGKIEECRSTVIDISARKRAEEERGHFAEQLQRSLLQTIRAIALTIEKRDPYTSGHQERVADLAVRIGQALGLGEDDLEGIRLGALIHDIGKIFIPAEILSRPGTLGPEMYSLIKTHPHSGYEIIGGIEFPWPLAEVVLQHHERLDGSGYPNGLRGEEILFEARILAVADVVEAMASHRPYRAGLGLDKALDEIVHGKGLLYDEQVVDACLRVFRDEQEMAEWVSSTQSR